MKFVSHFSFPLTNNPGGTRTGNQVSSRSCFFSGPFHPCQHSIFISHQIASLRGCHIVIATTGRLIDLLDRRALSLSKCKYVILDEADRMLDMGFEPAVRYIMQECDLNPDHQTGLFSATFPVDIQMMATDFLKHWLFIVIGEVGSTVSFLHCFNLMMSVIGS